MKLPRQLRLKSKRANRRRTKRLMQRQLLKRETTVITPKVMGFSWIPDYEYIEERLPGGRFSITRVNTGRRTKIRDNVVDPGVSGIYTWPVPAKFVDTPCRHSSTRSDKYWYPSQQEAKSDIDFKEQLEPDVVVNGFLRNYRDEEYDTEEEFYERQYAEDVRNGLFDSYDDYWLGDDVPDSRDDTNVGDWPYADEDDYWWDDDPLPFISPERMYDADMERGYRSRPSSLELTTVVDRDGVRFTSASGYRDDTEFHADDSEIPDCRNYQGPLPGPPKTHSERLKRIHRFNNFINPARQENAWLDHLNLGPFRLPSPSANSPMVHGVTS